MRSSIVVSLILVLSACAVRAQQPDIQSLIAQLQNRDTAQRVAAAHALGNLGARDATAIRALSGALNDVEADVSVTAAYALGEIGSHAKDAVPALVTALADDRSASWGSFAGPATVEDAAWFALHEIGPDAANAVAPYLRSENAKQRALAVWVLSAGEKKAEPYIASIVDLLAAEEKNVRYSAANALGELRTDPSKTIPALCSLLDDDDITIRIHAMRAIAKHGENGSAAVPLLNEQLGNEDGTLRGFSAYALGRIGNASRSAIPQLELMLSQDDVVEDTVFNGGKANALEGYGRHDTVSVWAARALGEIGPDAASAVPSLNQFISADTDEKMRIWAAAALVRIAADEPSAELGLALLVRSLSDERSRWDAAEALGSIGNDAAITALIDVLQAQDSSEFGTFREEVVKLLGQIGPPAKAAIPALRNALLGKRPLQFGVRREAARALGQIGPAAKIVIPELISLSNSDDEALRAIASEAVEQILAQSE